MGSVYTLAVRVPQHIGRSSQSAIRRNVVNVSPHARHRESYMGMARHLQPKDEHGGFQGQDRPYLANDLHTSASALATNASAVPGSGCAPTSADCTLAAALICAMVIAVSLSMFASASFRLYSSCAFICSVSRVRFASICANCA